MKKIISFSLWGRDPLYCNGAIWNAIEREKFYPDWNCRFYYDDSVPLEILDQIAITKSELVHMNMTTDSLGAFWRFHPMFDDYDIERFIVRDTDSKYTNREVLMVNEWIAGDKPFHIMRDHPSHGASILAGMWGAIPGCISQFERRISIYFNNLYPDTKNPRGLFHGCDQMFLNAHVWPIIKDNHIAHIRKGNPGLRYTGNEIEVDEPLDGHYVGMVA